MTIAMGTFIPLVYAANQNSDSTEERTVQLMKEKREERAKDMIKETPESSPLTAVNQKEIVEYYARTYLPSDGCSLLDLPKDSDINYTSPKPKKVKILSNKNTDKPDKDRTGKVKQRGKIESKVQKNNVEKKSTISIRKGSSINASTSDREWLEKLVEAEATGESYEGKIAVATVIANRMESSYFPNSITGVIKENNGTFHQFSPWDDGRIHTVKVTNSSKKAVNEVFDRGVRNLPSDTLYFTLESIVYDNWIGKTRKYVTTIGVHAFFSEKSK